MEQAWLYPQGKTIPKEFNQPIPSDIRSHYVDAGQNFHVPTVSDASSIRINLHFVRHNTKLVMHIFLPNSDHRIVAKQWWTFPIAIDWIP